MNKDQFKGKAEQFKGEIKKTWGRLTDDEVAYAEGNVDKFFGVLREKYGLAKEDAQSKFKEIQESCGCSDKAA